MSRACISNALTISNLVAFKLERRPPPVPTKTCYCNVSAYVLRYPICLSVNPIKSEYGLYSICVQYAWLERFQCLSGDIIERLPCLSGDIIERFPVVTSSKDSRVYLVTSSKDSPCLSGDIIERLPCLSGAIIESWKP